MKKLWAGRFKEKTAKVVEAFTESISFDRRLWRYDIEGSIAHAKMLGKQKIISREDAETIIAGLREIAEEISRGKFVFRHDLEDIHMNIEHALIQKIGDVGKKLHTARSRNDQVALDLRLYLRDAVTEIVALVKKLQTSLLETASQHLTTIMPGYTHLQRAQPVLLSHHLLAYVEMLQRDVERLRKVYDETNTMPLGSCALAGTSLPIDRRYVAKQLGFKAISENSIDAVSDRDFAIAFLSSSALLIMHLSRLAEELILWSTEEFGFIELPDAFTTGSSIMPQKKNPDVAELIRAKTGRVFGHLVALLTIMKGLPLSYNRDLQEDKVPVFDTVDTIKACLSVLNALLPKIVFQKEKMRTVASGGYSTATDIAEYLVTKGVPFRQAHEITGKIVRLCISKGKRLDQLSLEELRAFSPAFSSDILSALMVEESVKNKRSLGGTAPEEVKRQIRKLKKTVNSRL